MIQLHTQKTCFTMILFAVCVFCVQQYALPISFALHFNAYILLVWGSCRPYSLLPAASGTCVSTHMCLIVFVCFLVCSSSSSNRDQANLLFRSQKNTSTSPLVLRCLNRLVLPNFLRQPAIWDQLSNPALFVLCITFLVSSKGPPLFVSFSKQNRTEAIIVLHLSLIHIQMCIRDRYIYFWPSLNLLPSCRSVIKNTTYS